MLIERLDPVRERSASFPKRQHDGQHHVRAPARGLGFSKLISVGNESDLGGASYRPARRDEDTGRSAFLETFRDADKLAEAARRAYAVGKP